MNLMNRRKFLTYTVLSTSAFLLPTGCKTVFQNQTTSRLYLRSLLPAELLTLVDSRNRFTMKEFGGDINEIKKTDFRANFTAWVDSSLYSFIELRP